MISTKGRYALRLLVAIGRHPAGEYVPLKEVARQQKISEKYLEAIVRRLVASGILEGQRGRGGGYRLTRPAEEYSVGEILAIMEGTLAPVACMREDAPVCERTSVCETLPLWKQFYNLTQTYFNGVSIADLAAGDTLQTPTRPAAERGFVDGAGI
ncbi:MAG: Rrf2 family transcriptional regulator [Clostridia bacterium]|nr:Rrf2 family transcriptional regulator [Clostridia bacterium]